MPYIDPLDARNVASKRRHYEKHKQKILDRTRAARQENARIIREAKDRPCMDCGVKYPYFVMDFDHRDRADKSFTIGGSFTGRGRQQILAEIAKCDVVCSNCHRFRTQKEHACVAQ